MKPRQAITIAIEPTTRIEYQRDYYDNIHTLEKREHGTELFVKDTFGRAITYLRVSITDRCNMRCVYCMPENATFLPAGEILSYEEILRAVKVFSTAGIKKVRLTGGEPLARRNVDRLVRELSIVPGIEDLSLTTNGLLLEEMAGPLAVAGLRRVNVSLDTLDPEKFKKICRAGDIHSVIDGIRQANREGLRPVKVNVVVIRGKNDDEISGFLDFAMRENVIVRFIEYMPLKMDEAWKNGYVPREEMLQRAMGRLRPREKAASEINSPARYFEIDDTGLPAGFISPVSHGFCSNCNRMRLTPDGRLLSCLLSGRHVDIKTLLRNNCEDDKLIEAFRSAAAMKGEKGKFSEIRPMHKIGG